MEKLFYIEIRLQGQMYYDGYFIKKNNNQIMGFTNDSLIIGDSNCIQELLEDCEIITHDIKSKSYEDKGFFMICNDDEEVPMMVTIRKALDMTREEIIEEIYGLLQYYPEEIQKSFIENFA